MSRAYLLVDRGGLTHKHEGSSGSLGASVEDVDGLERHILQSGYVGSSSGSIPGLVSLQVVCEDVSVEPGGHGRGSEETEGALGVGELPEGGVVVHDSVALGGEPVDLGLVVVGGAREEVGGSSAEDFERKAVVSSAPESREAELRATHGRQVRPKQSTSSSR